MRDAIASGKVYQELTAMTGGEAFSMCEADYSPIFKAIAERVNAAASCEYAIPSPPEGQTAAYGKMKVEITPEGGEPTLLPNYPSEGASGGAGGWYYDDPETPQKILLCPASRAVLEASPGAVTRVLVGCETVHPA